MVVFNGRQHFSFGVLVWVLFAANGDFLNLPVVLLGALLPDCDTRFSTIGKFLPLWLVFKHRGFTHTWWGLILFSLIMWLLWNWWAAVSLALGYFSHLMLDACTPSGINWFGTQKSPRNRRGH